MKIVFTICYCLFPVALFAEGAKSFADVLVSHPAILSTHAEANNQRVSHGLPRLTLDAGLCVAAQRHANWMAQTGLFQHRPGEMGEIIAVGAGNPSQAIALWMNSPGHRAVILSGGRRVGWGCQRLHGRWYWVGVIR